jgi:hypothetical protein
MLTWLLGIFGRDEDFCRIEDLASAWIMSHTMFA